MPEACQPIDSAAMSPSHLHAQLYTQPTFVELFTPKLVTVFREGYGWRDVRADAGVRADRRCRGTSAIDGHRDRIGHFA
jgi:hypothetical protein